MSGPLPMLGIVNVLFLLLLTGAAGLSRTPQPCPQPKGTAMPDTTTTRTARSANVTLDRRTIGRKDLRKMGGWGLLRLGRLEAPRMWFLEHGAEATRTRVLEVELHNPDGTVTAVYRDLAGGPLSLTLLDIA